MPRVISMGDAVIDFFATPADVTLEEAKNFCPRPGGASANVAVSLARLGVDVGFIGTVGSDPFGSLLIKQLQLEGVDTTHFRQIGSSPTTVVFVAASSPHEQDFIVYRGADEKLQEKDLNPTYFTGATVLIFGSVALSGSSRQANLRAVRWANEADLLVVYDANWRPALWPNRDAARHGILAGLLGVSVCKLNEVELELLAGTKDLTVGSRWVLDQGVKLCLVTLGSKGAYFNNGQAEGNVPGFIVKTVDTTGCGDAFLSGLIAGLLETSQSIEILDESTLQQLVQFANATGALTATEKGAISALPTRTAVDAFLSTCID